MAKKNELISLRVDDIPLIYEVVHSWNIGAVVNQHYIPHGNWVGVSPVIF